MKAKALIFTVHRWLGIGMCLLFALWFASGIVMMYVEYPELTESERIGNLPLLDSGVVYYEPADIAISFDDDTQISSISLSSVMGRPAYLVVTDSARATTIFADSGERLQNLNAELAEAAVRSSGFSNPDLEPSYAEEIQYDQWSLTSSLDEHRPLHKVTLNDAAETVLYVSSKTGEIVRDTNHRERLWNWIGSTIHWIYPAQLRKNTSLWINTIIYISLIGLVSVFTGAIIGFMRIRIRKPYRGKDISPYAGWMKWHHILGIVTLVFVSTFLFSGLMSMGPWGIFNSNTPAAPQIARFQGNSNIDLSILTMPDFLSLSEPIKEVSWHQINSDPYQVITYANGNRLAMAHSKDSNKESMVLLDKIAEAIPALLPYANLIELKLIQQPDNYYYSRHNRYRPLPVYRAKFDDEESTWYHINVNTGEVVNRVTDASRRERWMYNSLHSLDFQFLLEKRPLWDIVMIALSIVGLSFSLTSVVIGWRRLIRGIT